MELPLHYIQQEEERGESVSGLVQEVEQEGEDQESRLRQTGHLGRQVRFRVVVTQLHQSSGLIFPTGAEISLSRLLLNC